MTLKTRTRLAVAQFINGSQCAFAQVFAIAAYIHPYPNKVGSLWVYVASLTSRG